jgi:hypothetical protein
VKGKRYFRVIDTRTGEVVSEHRTPRLALRAAQRSKHTAQHQDLRDENRWLGFDRWPTKEAVAAERVEIATCWREGKEMAPYYMAKAGQALGIATLHSLGLELVELEAMGLVELLDDHA